MKRLGSVFIVFGLGLLASPAVARAQAPGGQAPPPPKNLQILPKDISRPELIARMQGISQALGVRCQFCHVDDDPGRANDMASDEKPPKNMARAMMRFTGDLNGRLATALGKPAAEITQVQCATCHRGVPIPKQITEILAETAAQKGMPAAADQYRELRQKYYGGQSYDFSEGALAAFAQREVQANKPDEALQYLQLNLEFYPKSARTYLGMAQAYNRKGDKDQAIKNVEKALELDPENGQAKRMLAQLKK